MSAMRKGHRLNQGIAEAVEKAGRQSVLAAKIGRDQSSIWRYLNGQVVVPVSLALQLEHELQVPRWKTRPDLWKQEAHGNERS